MDNVNYTKHNFTSVNLKTITSDNYLAMEISASSPPILLFFRTWITSTNWYRVYPQIDFDT